jgi:hypothetical protein
VNHLKIHPEFSIFVFEGMITMGRGGEDLLDAVAREGLNISFGQALERIFGADLAYTLSTAIFFGTQYSETNTGFSEDMGRCKGDIPGPTIV